MKNSRDRRPYIRPVTRVELSEKDVKKRTVLAIVFLAIAVIAIGYGLFSLVNTQPGWVEVTGSSREPNVSSDVKLMYDFSRSGGSATAENKKLSLIYTQACRDAHVVFSPDEPTGGIAALTAAPGEAVKVDPALWEAFRLLEEHGDRTVYLAPVYTEYARVFRSEGDGEAMVYDPAHSEEAAQLVRELASYCADPEHIRVEVLEDNCLRLVLSEEYRAYAAEYGLETLLDFGWMRGAFVVDLIADRLLENGFTKGYLISFDGFARYLGAGEEPFTVNVYHKRGNDLYRPAQVAFQGPMAWVRLRTYPAEVRDREHSYVYADGTAVSAHIDPTDGMNRTGAEDLLVLGERCCAELALEAAPRFIGEKLEEEALRESLEKGIAYVWCEGTKVLTTDPDLALTLTDGTYTK